MTAPSTAATIAKKYLTATQARRILGVGRTKFYEMRRSKAFPEYRLPHRTGPAFLEDDMVKFILDGIHRSFVGSDRRLPMVPNIIGDALPRPSEDIFEIVKRSVG
jgi:hypothetical protein